MHHQDVQHLTPHPKLSLALGRGKISGYVVKKRPCLVEKCGNSVAKLWLYGGKRSLIGVVTRCGIEVAYASFGNNNLGLSRVLFQFAAQAVDILFDKFRVTFII